MSRSALARGESSYRLPEVRVGIHVALTTQSRVLWSQEVDPPSPQAATQDLVAFGDGIVAAASRGKICAFSESEGRRLWCTRGGYAPAFAGGRIAFSGDDGAAHAVDARTGTPLWRFRFAAGSNDAPAICSTGSSFLADGRAELSLSGKVIWLVERPKFWSCPVFRGRFGFETSSDSGATLVFYQSVVRLGPGGGLQMFRGSAVLDVHGNRLTFVPDISEYEEVDERKLTVDVWTARLPDVSIGSTYRFAPDYDRNKKDFDTRYGNRGTWVERDWVYATIGGRLYRYRLASPVGQRPLLVSDGARIIGGPYRGTFYVQRLDGVWTLHVRAGSIEARLVAPSQYYARAVWISRRTAYITTDDGQIRGVDVDDGHTVFNARLCSGARIATTATRTLIVCEGKPWRVHAFARPDQ